MSFRGSRGGYRPPPVRIQPEDRDAVNVVRNRRNVADFGPPAVRTRAVPHRGIYGRRGRPPGMGQPTPGRGGFRPPPTGPRNPAPVRHNWEVQDQTHVAVSDVGSGGQVATSSRQAFSLPTRPDWNYEPGPSRTTKAYSPSHPVNGEEESTTNDSLNGQTVQPATPNSRHTHFSNYPAPTEVALPRDGYSRAETPPPTLPNEASGSVPPVTENEPVNAPPPVKKMTFLPTRTKAHREHIANRAKSGSTAPTTSRDGEGKSRETEQRDVKPTREELDILDRREKKRQVVDAEDIKPTREQLEASEESAVGQTLEDDLSRKEGVLHISKKDLPPNCFARKLETRETARFHVLDREKKTLREQGRIVITKIWRDDGVAIDWRKDDSDIDPRIQRMSRESMSQPSSAAQSPVQQVTEGSIPKSMMTNAKPVESRPPKWATEPSSSQSQSQPGGITQPTPSGSSFSKQPASSSDFDLPSSSATKSIAKQGVTKPLDIHPFHASRPKSPQHTANSKASSPVDDQRPPATLSTQPQPAPASTSKRKHISNTESDGNKLNGSTSAPSNSNESKEEAAKPALDEESDPKSSSATPAKKKKLSKKEKLRLYTSGRADELSNSDQRYCRKQQEKREATLAARAAASNESAVEAAPHSRSSPTSPPSKKLKTEHSATPGPSTDERKPSATPGPPISAMSREALEASINDKLTKIDTWFGMQETFPDRADMIQKQIDRVENEIMRLNGELDRMNNQA